MTLADRADVSGGAAGNFAERGAASLRDEAVKTA